MREQYMTLGQDVLSFENFEVNFEQWELRKHGIRLPLQKKPFLILKLLMQRPGQLVTRTELARLLWPDLHVDYERSLNTAVNALRQVLGDSGRSSHFIETCSGLGYRFIAPVQVSETLKARYSVPNHHRSASAESAEAQLDCAKGRYFYDKMTVEAMGRAAAYYESACRMDPHCALAYVGLAEIQNLLAMWSVVPTRAASKRALDFAECAMSADPELAEAHVALATANRILKQPPADVEQRYRTALKLDSRCAAAHLWYGDFLCAHARFEEGKAALKRAAQTSPLSLIISSKLAWAFYVSGDYASSVEQSWKALTLEPSFAPAQYTLGLAYQQLGNIEDATVEFQNACKCSGEHPEMIAALTHLFAEAGMFPEAESLKHDMARIACERYVSPYWRAISHSAVGLGSEAAQLITQAREEGDFAVEWLAVDPRMESLRRLCDRALAFCH